MNDKRIDWKELAERAWDSPSWEEAAKQECQPPPSNQQGNGAAASTDQNTIDALARLGGLACQKQRLQEAKRLRIPVAALDKLVRQAQARAEDSSAELPHWKVEPWNEPIDGALLLADIEQVFVRYVFLPTGASVALALWVLHAWTMDAGDISPFMVLISPTKRCGNDRPDYPLLSDAAIRAREQCLAERALSLH